MKIKISLKNAAKINAALEAVNGRATSFAISSYVAVADYAADVEKRLAASQLPKAERPGAIAHITPAGPTAKAYKYAAKSTTIRLERGSQDWFLTDVTETSIYPRQSEFVSITISCAQRDTIARKALEGYRVTSTPQTTAA